MEPLGADKTRTVKIDEAGNYTYTDIRKSNSVIKTEEVPIPAAPVSCTYKTQKYPWQSFRETVAMQGGHTFEDEIRQVINKWSEENPSNTPDFILARYLLNCLDTFNIAVQAREEWYGRRTF
jgi:hypothetical protein